LLGFQHVLADLRTEGSPAQVIEVAERAVADERRHAEFCRHWAIRFGHPGGEFRARGDKPIAFRGATAGQNRLLRITYCCMNETVGCFVLRHVRPALTLLELRELNRLHSEDEVQHSRVGWAHLATLSPAQREFLAPWVPVLLRLVQTTWCEGSELEREENAEHRLFHVLVLMGGGLALSCGGAVSFQGNSDGSAAGAAQQERAGAVSSTGGSGIAGASWATAGAVSTNTGGSGLASAGASSEGEASGPGVNAGVTSLPCSPGQWDCAAVLGHCGAQLDDADLPAGCFCAPRPPVGGRLRRRRNARVCSSLSICDRHKPSHSMRLRADLRDGLPNAMHGLLR
jgi:hypothetical protein